MMPILERLLQRNGIAPLQQRFPLIEACFGRALAIKDDGSAWYRGVGC